ncbi:Putative NADH-flavin reductase [Nakamurella panacisegetis]|uniref:Putative NADH-flavin reductase n=1 Tax=Nakamurella panacisegetis TaxID=1090615 RepID=A0A1H0MQK6_9ACTN|nr:NAD(P)H-binding protein [Nakamurella panacisegetis]SDO82430.1 Putative NADH-flavin reductase [Nakamurella panacisegetis]
MKVVIAGGHGRIALHLERLLAERGDHPVGLIRNPLHEADVIAAGAYPVLIDLENTTAAALSEHLSGADAVVFAAGAGAGSSAERKDSVDRAGAALLADAAILAGVRRYLLVSAIGSDAGAQPEHDPVFAAYMTAKQAADEDLRTRDLDWTVIRPGALTSESGSGHVTLTTRVGRGSVPREDVAAVLVALLDEPRTAGLSLDLVSGRHPIAEAVAATVLAGAEGAPTAENGEN